MVASSDFFSNIRQKRGESCSAKLNGNPCGIEDKEDLMIFLDLGVYEFYWVTPPLCFNLFLLLSILDCVRRISFNLADSESGFLRVLEP